MGGLLNGYSLRGWLMEDRETTDFWFFLVLVVGLTGIQRQIAGIFEELSFSFSKAAFEGENPG